VDWRQLKIMKFPRSLIWFTFSLFLLSKGSADTHENALPTDPLLVSGQLENGFRYAILPNSEPPLRVSVRLYVSAGSLQEEDHEQGLAHFVEHMAFNGTTNFAPGDMVTYFQRLGMAFGPDTNAYTGFDQTVYILEMPRNEEGILRDGFLLLRDYASGMLMLEEEIESERGVIINEKRFRDTVNFRNTQAIYRFLLPDSLFPQRWPIGIAPVILGADRDTFVRFYDDWYRPERMALIIVGDVDPETIREWVIEFFGDMEARAPVREAMPLGPVTTEGLRFGYHFEEEATATNLYLLHSQPADERPDSFEKRLSNVQTDLAYTIVNRRLDRLSRSAERPFLSSGAFNNLMPGPFRVDGLFATTELEKIDLTLSTLEQVLRQTLTYGFTEAEVREARARLDNSLLQAVAAAPTRRSNDLAGQLLETVRFHEAFMTPEQELALIEAMSDQLTAEALTEAFRAGFTEGNLAVFMISPEVIPEAVEQMEATWAASRATEVSPPDESEDLEFAYQIFGEEPGQILSRTVHDDLGIVQVRFANGVRLNYMSNDFERGQIRLSLRVGLGLIDTPFDGLALATKAGMVFEEGGLGAHTLDELESILAGKTVSFNFGVSEDAFVFSGATQAENLRDQLNLFTAYLVDPALREEAFTRARGVFPIMARQASTTLEGVFRNEVERFLMGGDPLVGLPTVEEFVTVGPQDLAQWLMPALSQGYLEISVVGDFDPETLEAAVAQTIGSLPERNSWFTLPASRLGRMLPYPEEEAFTFTYPTELPRAASVVVWPMTDGRNIALNRRLAILRSIVNDRFRVKVREEMGDTYGVSTRLSLSDIHLGYGHMAAITITEPHRVAAVEEAIIVTVQEMLGEGINQDEFERAMEPFKASVERSRRDNGYWLNSVLSGSAAQPFQIDLARDRSADVERISLEEIQYLAEAFLPSEPLRIRIVPQRAE
jgi:zinc protease